MTDWLWAPDTYAVELIENQLLRIIGQEPQGSNAEVEERFQHLLNIFSSNLDKMSFISHEYANIWGCHDLRLIRWLTWFMDPLIRPQDFNVHVLMSADQKTAAWRQQRVTGWTRHGSLVTSPITPGSILQLLQVHLRRIHPLADCP